MTAAASVTWDLERLSQLGARGGGVRRLAWSDEHRASLDWWASRLEESGLAAELDPAGNLIGRWDCGEGDAVMLGSHLDTGPDAGRYDGALGVLGALAAVELLKAAGTEPQRPIWIASFMDEEGVRFGVSMIGSRAFVGQDVSAQLRRTDAEGVSIEREMQRWGLDPSRIAAARAIDGVGAYLELHVEQGPVLERCGETIGVVDHITGLFKWLIRFHGEANHAGTTPMDMRRDAGLAAAAAALAIERIPATEGGVATTGELRLLPGIPTAVAGAALLTVDLRNPDAGALARMLDSARSACKAAAEERHVGVSDETLWRIEPISFDPDLVAAGRDACAEVAGKPAELASGALHDAAEVARVLPAAMLFCPSKAGISHAREEDTDEADLAVAIEAFGALAARVLSR